MSEASYYHRELERLRHQAARFAEAHPSLAPLLSGPSADSDVERILEGVAFLTGSIRKRLDDDLPDFAQALMQLIYPHYLRPLPAATIMVFPPKNILKDRLCIPAGTCVDSSEVDGVSCRFSTCYDLEVLPLRLLSARGEEQGANHSIIELQFQLSATSLSQWQPQSLRLYLAGDYPGASDLYLLLQEHLQGITTVDGLGVERRLPRAHVSRVGFSSNEALLSYPKHSFPAYRLIQEYFMLKEKFLFIDLKDLHGLQTLDAGQFILRLHLNTASLRLPSIDTNRFVLHAIPAVNLFEHEAEPVTLDQRRSEIEIKPRKSRNGQYTIHQVRRVLGYNRRSGEKLEYGSLGMFALAEGGGPVYEARFQAREDNGDEILKLNLNYPPGYPIPLQETLMVSLVCSNGNLASRLRPGDISRPTSQTSELVEFENILSPSTAVPSPAGNGILWRLLSHLSLNYLPLADAKNFRSLLELYVFPGTGSRKSEMANRKRIEGIRSITVKPADCLIGGIPMRGQNIEVTVGREHFSSLGDFYLFGAIADQLFSSFTTINCYTQTTLVEASTGEQFQWPARLGNRPLI